MSKLSEISNQSIPPSSELAAAYNELKYFFTYKGLDFFESIDKNTTATQPLNQGKASFMSTVISREGAFYSEDLFGNRNLAKAYSLKPVNDSSGNNIGDVSCYGCQPSKNYDANSIYNDLYKFIGLSPKNTTSTPAAQSSQQVSADNTSSPTEVPIKPDESRDQTATNISNQNEASTNDLICSVINKSASTPDALVNPHISLYRYSNPYMSISMASSEYCNVFFNSIDNINMSLCVPYVKINFIDRMSKKTGSYPPMSLVAFLKQSTSSDINDKIFYNAKPILRDANDPISKKILAGSVLGMESFLSPGTLLPDPTDILKSQRALDPSVPLMSLEGLSINFKSLNTGALATRIANLSITLHDRSRMKDLAVMLKPVNWSMMYCEIEWGWIHPHAGPQFNNPVARYLNALRVRDIFTTISYNVSLTAGNAANISIDLIAAGVGDSSSSSVYDGNYIKKSYAVDLLDSYIKSKIAGDETKIRNSITNIMPVVHMQVGNERHGTQVKREFLTKIVEASNKDKGLSEEEDKKLMDELAQIVTQSKNISNTDLALQKERLLRKLNVTGFGEKTFELMQKRYAGVSREDYISVGSFLTAYIAMPLASLGLYDEVQIHTFCFNKGAGMIGGRPISDACIKIADIMKQLEKNDSVTSALAVLSSFLSDPNLPTYGNTSLSSPVVKETDTAAGVPNVDSQEQLKAERDAAITGAETTIKTMPNIGSHMFTQPARVFDEKSDNIAKNAVAQPDKKILQIILYDKNAAANTDEIINAYDYVTKRRPTDFQSDTLSIDQVKEISKIAYPSLVYGATNSVIETINVSTATTPAIRDQAIIDSTKSSITENSQSETMSDITDITVIPGTVTLSLIGMPYIEVGQEIYLDMGTGTSLDNVYIVRSVGHTLKGMKFNTSVSLNQIGQGILTNVNNTITSYRKTLSQSAAVSTITSTSTSATITAEDANNIQAGKI